jgi:hypothetical protein
VDSQSPIDQDPRFARAVQAFREISAADPARETVGSEQRPRELVRAEQLVAWLQRLASDAPLALRLAAHAQHVGRYLTPRSSYPEGRTGYLRWRSDLSKQHAERAQTVLQAAGYDEPVIERVRSIVLKAHRTSDADVQTMEDALCLSFLEHEFAEFSRSHTDEKLVSIVQKTWRKMSDRAHTLAGTLPFSGRAGSLVERALSGPDAAP